MNYKKMPVTISNNGRELFGVFITPETKEEFPVVVCSHGYNGSGKDFEEMGEIFAENGIGAFCYDFCGGSVNSRSSMETTDMTIFTEKEDLLTVLSYLQKSKLVSKENIFLFGGSQGGLVSALVADEKIEEIRGLVLLFPAMCIAKDWNERYKNDEDIPEKEDLWGMTLGKVFCMSLRGFDVYEHIGKFEKKVLIMHGDKDPIVTLEFSERLEKVYKDMHLEVFKNEGHGFSKEGNDKVTKMTLEFIKDNIV